MNNDDGNLELKYKAKADEFEMIDGWELGY